MNCMNCKNCGNVKDFKVREVEAHHGLYCGACGRWQKWLSKKERDRYKAQEGVNGADDVDLRFHIWSDMGILEQKMTCRSEVLDEVMCERMKSLKDSKDVFRVTADITFLGRA